MIQKGAPAKRSTVPLTLLCLIFVTFISYFTYFHNFAEPQGFFWDENYHVAAAQKYLSGIFFMEPHPPLGKLLIALGEAITDWSANDEQFISTNYASGDFTDGFVITGYRLIPVLLSWLTAPLLFFIFLLITGNPLFATLFSFLYVFDNALIVHGRGAMLEGSLLFFSTLSVLWFLLLLRLRNETRSFVLCSIHLGIALALVVTTKLTGLVLTLLVPATLFILYPDWQKALSFFLHLSAGFLITFSAVWQLHFSLGRTVHPALENNGWYQATEATKTIVHQGKNEVSGAGLSFRTLLRDAQRFTAHYERGVPRLDLCKSDENGSPFFLWPIGARAINYRWALYQSPPETQGVPVQGDALNPSEASGSGQASYRYLYLQSNPVVWFTGLTGVLLALAYVLGTVFSGTARKRSEYSFLIRTFLVLYLAYMFVMSQFDRVMYLYHYFPPLIFSFLLFALVCMEMKKIGKTVLTNTHKAAGLLVLAALIFVSYQFYRPLTYYEPITDDAFKKRALIDLWDLRCVNCERTSPLVRPR